jgi:hypothetical protein
MNFKSRLLLSRELGKGRIVHTPFMVTDAPPSGVQAVSLDVT